MNSHYGALAHPNFKASKFRWLEIDAEWFFRQKSFSVSSLYFRPVISSNIARWLRIYPHVSKQNTKIIFQQINTESHLQIKKTFNLALRHIEALNSSLTRHWSYNCPRKVISKKKFKRNEKFSWLQTQKKLKISWELDHHKAPQHHRRFQCDALFCRKTNIIFFSAMMLSQLYESCGWNSFSFTFQQRKIMIEDWAVVDLGA